MSTEVMVAVLPPCDLCATAGVSTTAGYDGKTILGPWANMCPGCFERFGVGLGTGRGQRLILRNDSSSFSLGDRVYGEHDLVRGPGQISASRVVRGQVTAVNDDGTVTVRSDDTGESVRLTPVALEPLIGPTTDFASVASERVTLLAGGDTIYLYAVGNPNIDAMEAVLDVAYPGSDVERRTIPVSTWETVRPKLIEAGVEIVDTRKSDEEETP